MGGIDYGMGTTNVDTETGIRYGVISANRLGFWNEESEPDYGDPACPDCGGAVVEYEEEKHGAFPVHTDTYFKNAVDVSEYVCESCHLIHGNDCVWGDEPVGFNLDDRTYTATQSADSSDVFIFKSPYYTLCDFCSPCAPGAGYLTGVDREDGVKAYCFGEGMFDKDIDGGCPYPYWQVSDGSLVYEPDGDTEEEDA